MASDYASRLGGARSSLAFKAPCRAATTVNISLTGEQTIDGVAVVANDRVLVKNQTLSYENGIYKVKTTAWVRDRDFDGADDAVTGTRVFVHSGTVNGGTMFQVTSADPITIGDSAVAWEAAGDNDAANITFTQSGTGAVERTVQAKLRERITPEDFDAIGNGIADDYTPLQRAINEAYSRGGGIVHCPNKYYLSASPIVKDGVTLEGDFCYPEQYDTTTATNYYNLNSQLRLGAGVTIIMDGATACRNMLVIRHGLSIPATNHTQRQTVIGQFSGTAFGSGGTFAGSAIGYQILLENLLVLGHTNLTNFSADGGVQPGRVDCVNVRGDNTNGILVDSSGDVCRSFRCHMYPYLTFDPAGNEADHLRSGYGFFAQNVNDWFNYTDCFVFGYAYGFCAVNTTAIQTGGSLISYKSCRADHPSGADLSPNPCFYFPNAYSGASGGSEYITIIDAVVHGYAKGVYWNTERPSGNDTLTVTSSSFVCTTGIEVDKGFLLANLNLFQAATTGINLLTGCTGAILEGNRFDGCVTPIANATSSDVMIRGNAGVGSKMGWTSNCSPAVTDGAALGTSSLMWSDLFLALGAVINWNNGNVTLTHSAGALTFSGANISTGTGGLTTGGGFLNATATAKDSTTNPNFQATTAELIGSSPDLIWYRSTSGTNEKYWDLVQGAATLTLRALNDSFASPTSVMAITRSGTTISSIIFGGPTTATELRATSDVGGQASAVSISNVSSLTANSTGVGTILFKGTTSRNSSGFFKVYIDTTAYYVPVFSAISG